MNRILKIYYSDIIEDPEQASSVLSKACARQRRMIVTGLCVRQDCLIAVMEETQLKDTVEYVFAPFPLPDEDSFIAELNRRFFGGFSTISSFLIGDTHWGLFSQTVMTRSDRNKNGNLSWP